MSQQEQYVLLLLLLLLLDWECVCDCECDFEYKSDRECDRECECEYAEEAMKGPAADSCLRCKVSAAVHQAAPETSHVRLNTGGGRCKAVSCFQRELGRFTAYNMCLPPFTSSLLPPPSP